jgi:hypothetical protein
MSESRATRIHAGDKSLKYSKKGRVVSVEKSKAAKAKNSPLAIWRKVTKVYLSKGGFVTIPKRGTKEHRVLTEMYQKELAKSR